MQPGLIYSCIQLKPGVSGFFKIAMGKILTDIGSEAHVHLKTNQKKVAPSN